MAAATFINGSLVDELIRFVGMVDERIAALQAHVASGAGSESPRQHAENQLPEALIEGAGVDLMRQIRSLGDAAAIAHRELPAEVIAEFTYLLAAWVDETLIRIFSERLPRFNGGMVEYQLFGTMDAGEQIFAKIERIIARRSYSDICLAAAYLLALSLGFRGQYSEHGTSNELARYHRELSLIALLPSDRAADPQVALSTASLHSDGPGILGKLRPGLLWTGVGMVWLVAIIALEVKWHRALEPVQHALAGLTAASQASLRSTAKEDSN